MNFQRLLVPIDFGAAADRAVDLAIALGRRFDGRIELVHAFYLPPSVYAMDSTIGPFPVAAVEEKERKAFDAVLDATRVRYPRTTARWFNGEPRESILRVAKEDGADVIVMGTHGYGAIRRALFGCVAERIIRTSPIPVLTTPAPPKTADGLPPVAFRSILVPVDFGEPADHAIEVGADLASKFEAKLTLLHAYEVPHAVRDEPVGWPAHAAARSAERGLEQAAGRLRLPRDRVEAMVVRGDPRQAVIDAVVERNVDFVVMGTHQRRGLSRLLLGSVAEHVVRACPAPVLTVSADE